MIITKQEIKMCNKWESTNGGSKIVLDKNELHFFNDGLFQDMNNKIAVMWIKDLDNIIRYLRRLKYFLNKNGIKTNHKKFKKEIKKHEY